jgi:hypothetical protein
LEGSGVFKALDQDSNPFVDWQCLDESRIELRTFLRQSPLCLATNYEWRRRFFWRGFVVSSWLRQGHWSNKIRKLFVMTTDNVAVPQCDQVVPCCVGTDRTQVVVDEHFADGDVPAVPAPTARAASCKDLLGCGDFADAKQ